jgi:ADP-ribosylglycohydrolase
MDLLTRYRGGLLGLATGDALGAPVEFCAPSTFAPVTTMRSGGPFGLPAGTWTDDTSMALCLAESLIERQGFDALDQMCRYCRWYHEGHLSSTGHCFDIGNTTAAALRAFERTHDPYSGCTEPGTAGNGSLMRLAPVPMFYMADPKMVVSHAALSSKTTHGASAAVDSCRYFSALILGALQGRPRQELLEGAFVPYEGCWDEEPLCPEVREVACGSFRRKRPPEVRGSGYVVASLEAALWAFARTHTFKEGALEAVNLGDDADTTGAVYGQIAGAFYGAEGIPRTWLDTLAHRSLVDRFAQRLFEHRYLP